jgi:hypothetical protein
VLVMNDGNVRAIHLTGGQIKDDELRHLTTTPRPTLLNLDGSTITVDALQHIRALPEPTIMRVCRTSITDDGLARIDNLPKLASVIRNTAVTDAGLLHLVRFKSFTFITCMGCPVSGRTQALVHELLPNCRVKL